MSNILNFIFLFIIICLLNFGIVQSAPSSNISNIDYQSPVIQQKYSSWTKWARCDDSICERKRFRVCLFHANNSTVHCPHGPILVQSKACKKKNCLKNSLTKMRRYSLSNRLFDFFDTSLLLEDFYFSSWTRWTDCYLRDCQQYRWKICVEPLVCGDKIRIQYKLCDQDLRDLCLDYLTSEEYNSEYPWTAPVTTTTESPSVYTDDAVWDVTTQSSFQEESLPAVSSGKNLECGIAPLAKRKVTTKIFGGRESAAGQWPWQVALVDRQYRHYCAGILVNNWVITAAHCYKPRMSILLGEHNVDQEDHSEQYYHPSKTILHKNFNLVTVENDIALIKLDNVRWSHYVHPICLPDSIDDSHLLNTTTNCVVAGWGKRLPYLPDGSLVLHQAQVKVIDHTTCQRAYRDEHVITEKMLCAGSRPGQRGDTCQGDSGGPLMCRTEVKGKKPGPWTVYGITSFGDSCGKRNKYGVYTRVSAYMHWINTNMR